MEPLIWVKFDDKWAFILVLRGHELSRLSVTALLLRKKFQKVQSVVEALQQGQSPAETGVKSVETLDTRSIGKAEVSPGNGSLKLHSEGSKSISFATADSNAHEILQTILERSGKAFQATQEEIGVFEALVPPAIVGVVGGLIWAGLNQAANKIASGEEIEVKGRRQGLQRLMVTVAENLGPNGVLVAGVALLVLVIGWAALRVTRRPQRTVFLPDQA